MGGGGKGRKPLKSDKKELLKDSIKRSLQKLEITKGKKKKN